MKFRILALLSVLIMVGALQAGCSKGGKKDKPKAADPNAKASPIADANKQVISPQRAAELAKNLEETSAVLKKLSGSSGSAETGGTTTPTTTAAIAGGEPNGVSPDTSNRFKYAATQPKSVNEPKGNATGGKSPGAQAPGGGIGAGSTDTASAEQNPAKASNTKKEELSASGYSGGGRRRFCKTRWD